MYMQAITVLMSTIGLDTVFSLSVATMALFCRQICDLWEKVYFFLCYSLRGIICTLKMFFAVTFGLLLTAGRKGTFIIDEYSNTHIFPLVSLICVEFAEFLMDLFDFYMDRLQTVNAKALTTVDFEEEAFNTQYYVFEQPSLVMLQ